MRGKLKAMRFDELVVEYYDSNGSTCYAQLKSVVSTPMFLDFTNAKVYHCGKSAEIMGNHEAVLMDGKIYFR